MSGSSILFHLLLRKLPGSFVFRNYFLNSGDQKVAHISNENWEVSWHSIKLQEQESGKNNIHCSLSISVLLQEESENLVDLSVQFGIMNKGPLAQHLFSSFENKCQDSTFRKSSEVTEEYFSLRTSVVALIHFSILM